MASNAPELDPDPGSTARHRRAFRCSCGRRRRLPDLVRRRPRAGLRARISSRSLNIVRLAVNQKLRQERFEEILQDARRIQSSILPKRTPRYADFDIAGDSRPAEVVGGDFYDYIPVTNDMFDLVIADASGHGLPAALQVRDIYVGLRMGLTRDFKIGAHRGAAELDHQPFQARIEVRLDVLAELETNGNMIYVNAGHVLPFILHDDGTSSISARVAWSSGRRPTRPIGAGLHTSNRAT